MWPRLVPLSVVPLRQTLHPFRNHEQDLPFIKLPPTSNPSPPNFLPLFTRGESSLQCSSSKSNSDKGKSRGQQQQQQTSVTFASTPGFDFLGKSKVDLFEGASYYVVAVTSPFPEMEKRSFSSI